MIDTTTLKSNISVSRDIVAPSPLHSVFAVSSAEMAGPCPRCGGTDRFHATDAWWFCRQCHPQRGDAIEYQRWLHGVDFRTACAMLAGGGSAIVAPPKPKRKATPHWHVHAEKAAQRAAMRLESEKGTLGREYLEKRGIGPETWLEWRLGYVEAVPGQQAPAIAMPWYSDGGKVQAIRYRFLTPQAGQKQSAMLGSRFSGLLYGPRHDRVCTAQRTLVIVEGEMNAISIWQAAHDTRLDVLSIGSESATVAPEMLDIANQYRDIIVWADREEKAQSLIGAMPGAFGIAPQHDANDMLQAGQLRGYLSSVRRDAIQLGDSANKAFRLEALLWDLWDCQLASGDDVTATVIAQLAHDTGKSI